MQGELFQRSDRGYCSDVQLWRRFESGEWIPHDFDRESRVERVKTTDDEVIELSPVSPSELPDGVEARSVEEDVVVIDERDEDDTSGGDDRGRELDA